MPIDAAATDRLKDDPQHFLRDHFVKVAGYGTIGPAATWQALGGGAVAPKLFAGTIATMTLGTVPVTADDCLEVLTIGGRAPPTCYIGLEPDAVKPDYFLGQVRPDKQPGYRRVLYLPARANQITLLKLPAAGGPDLMFTDPLTGCTVYFGTIGPQEVVCHANGLALIGADSNNYMKGLKNAIPGFARTASLKKGEYRAHQAQLQQTAQTDKQAMGRANVVAQITNYTTVCGVRVGGHWRIFYQDYADVQSTRTGLKAKVMGATSRKARVGLQQVT
ncbi:MAG: hypothetical protein ACT4P7_15755, partial [Gemmatimonadaceae bacterium]